MKLHLPKSLRGALLACFASVAGLTTTVATGTFVGGAFYVSLASVAQADDVSVNSNTIWSNADAATHADDTVTVDGGDTPITLQVGQGTTSPLTGGASIDFGTVTVNAGNTLKLWNWTNTNKGLGSANKVSIQSAITLNDAELRMEDGSYYFAEAITISGTSSIRSQYAKGVSLAGIVGDKDAVLQLVRGIGTPEEKDNTRAVFELTGANESFEGTVKLVDDNGSNTGQEDGLQLVLSNAKALVNAVLDFGETDDVVLSLNATKVLLKAIKGHGFVEYYNSTFTVGEIELTAATGTFSGSSAANVDWTISGGNQGLSNASILGTYTVGESASSAFEGSITLGALVNNSTTGIDVSNMTSLTINNQTAYQGATISGLGLLTGLSGNTFTYGNGWLATYDSATGTATLSDDSAIYWVDAGGADDTDNDWASASNWQGGAVPSSTDTVRLGADAANKTIAFAADAAIGQARVVQGDYVFTTDGNVTLTGAISVVPTGASLSKAGAGTLTLTNVAANTLASSAGTLTVNTLNLYTGDTFTKTGAGLMTLTNADTLLGKNITVEAGELHITQTGNVQVTAGSATTVTVKSGATLDDDRRLNVTGGSFTVTGGGVYELEGISLSAAAKAATTLNVQADTVLHITGGTQDASGQLGSFMLSHWAANNIININGLLVSDVGISDRDGSGTLHVEDGGVLQLNAGMSRTTHGDKDTTINVKSGASLVVNGTATSGTDYITTNLAEGATVFTTEGATILNALRYNGAVELGAAADTILSLTATTPNVGTITILGTGDTVKTFANDAVSQTAAGGTVKYTNAVSGTAITLNAGAKFEAAAGLNLSGSLTLAANSEAKLGGAVTVGSIANSGTIDVSALQSLRLGADAGSMGAYVNLGTVDYNAGDTFTYGNGWTATWQNDGRALITGDSAIAWADTGAEGDTDINWNTADNWSGATAPTATDYVQLAATEGVTRTLALTADTTVAGLRVYDAYTLSVGEGTTAAFTATNGIELNGDTAKLSKAGTGTLSMTSAQSIAAKMSVTEGTLKLTDTLASAPLNTVTAQDLSALSSSASGVLAVTAGGAAGTPGASSNNNYQGPTVSAISLADSFTGAVEVLGGKLSVTKSNLGGTSLLHLNGGGLLVSSNGTAFATQELAYNLHVGVNGGYLDHYGGSGSKEDTWSSKHTGTMTGSGALTLTGYGEWMFAGTYTNFTGSIKFGNQAQRVYLSSDMTGLTGLLATATEVAVGYKSAGDSAVSVAVSGKETLSGNRTMYFANGSTFTHSGGVEVAAGKTLSVQGYTSGQTGTFNAANVELAAGSGDTAAAIFSVGTGIEANLTNTAAYTATAGTISIATDATVNDSRALTIDGAYNISGAGAYNQLGSLALTANGALTLSGVVSINSLAGHNAGTITFADTLTSLELKDFTLGADYNIGTVTNGENVDWGTLLGYGSSSEYSFTYANGILSSASLGAISWGSPADEDITWGGANWKTANGSELISISSTDSVVLDVIDTSAETPVSPTIELTANTTVAGLVVNDAYNLSIAEGATYSFAADSYGFGANGSLSKTGAGTLSMSLAQAQSAKMHITEGALKLTDAFSHTLTQSISGRVNYDLSGITAGADGVLQVDLNGTWNGTGLDATALALDAQFLGTLEVIDGQLLVKFGDAATDGKSYFGSARAIRLNKGALFFYANSSLDVAALEIAAGNGYITNRSGLSTISSTLSGSGNLTVQAKDGAQTIKLTGVVDLDGKLTNTSGTLTLESATKAQFDGGVLLSGGTININSAADISELSVTGGTFKINGAEVGVATLKTGSALTLTGAAHLTAGLEDGSAVTLNGADTASATLTVAENGTANLQTGLVLDTLTVNAGGTLALSGAVTLDNLVNNAQLDLTNLTSLTLTQQQAYDGAVITGLGSLTGLTNNHFTYADGWLAEYDATNRTATILANAIWSDGGDDDNIIWADASNWTGGGTAGYTLQETDRVRLGTEAAGKQILVTADSTVAGITVRAPYTFSVADTESWTLTAPITFLENGAITKTGAGSLTLTSDLVTNELTVNEGTLTTGDVTPATGTTFTQSGSGTLVVDAVTANEVSVAGSMSATTAATADGTTFIKSGAGSLNVGTLTANEANVTGNMSATAVNLSDGNAFTKSGEGAMEIGTLNANSATVSAGSLSVDTATLKSGNTFTKAGANALGLGTTNATRLTVSEGDLKMTAWTLAAGTTATKTGAGTLTIAGDASALKGNLDVSEGNVTFETDAAFGTLAVHENHVYIGTESKNVNVSFTSSTYSDFSGHMDVAAGSTLTAESVSVNNSTYRLHGAGVYNIGKLSLATFNTGNMLVDTGLTVNVTGTTTTGTTDGSFVLGGSSSTIDVYGTLSLASGISATANSTNHVVNVGDGSNAGATLWLKDGLHAAVAENVSAVATINVKTGSNLIVDSANTANSDKFTVNLADGATVFTTAGGTILNAMQYTGTVKLGAAAGTTLDLTHAEQTDVNALTILGTADAVKGTNAGGTVAFTGKVSGASVTLNEGGRLTAAGGLNLTGALTLNSNAFATLSGEVSVGSLSNAGSIDVSGISALAIGDFALTSGATYNVGTLTGYESLNWNTLLGANESLSIAYNADTGYLSIATNMENPILWMGAEGATWDSTAADGSDTASWMQGDAAYAITPDSAVVLGNAATLGDSSDAVSRTILLDADTVVNSVTVQDAYALSVGADSSYSFDVGSIALEQGGSLSKTGEGTLSMSLEDAVAAQMAVNAGVLQISGVLADTAGGAAVGLSAISGSGTLHITPAGVNGNTNDGTRTAVSLGDAFTGTLKVSGGQLDAASTMGGAALVILDGATLTASGASVTELAWNIQVSDNDAHLRHFGNTGVDERTSYATRLTGALSGGAGAMLTVIDAGEWFFAGDMSNYAGGLSINGNTNYVTFEADATLASLAATAGSRVLVTNSATVGATTTATSGTGTVYAGADANATLNLGAVTIANGTTLDITGGGTHTADSVNMSAAATGLTLGANTSLTVTGALNGDGNTDTETLTITLGENARLSLGSAAHTQTIGSTIEISLGAKSLLTDAAVRRLGNSHLNITGSGVYELNALQLSNGANANTSVTIGAGATLHITGTTLNASGDGGSLLTGTQNYDNVITVNGTLALECGVSRYNIDDTANTINVNSGGKIAFNQGLTAANEGNDAAKDIINIKDGAVLEVSGTNTTGTNKLTVNIEQNGMVMGGNAGDVTESTIANNLVFANGAYIGAKAGTTLNIAPEADSMSIRWMDIIGTADAQEIAQGAGGKVAFAKAVTATETVKVLAGATAEFKQGLTVSGGNGLENSGTLTLNGANLNQFTNAANSSATFQGAITIAAMAGRNAGTIDVAGATSLALGDFSLTDGATYTIGALTGLSDTHTIGSLLGAGQYHDVTYDGTSTVSVVSHLVWDAQSATEGDNVWNTAADNLNWKVDTDTEKAFAADKVVVFAPNADAVNSTVVLGEDVTAGEVRLLGAYTFQADENRTLGGAVKLQSDDAALTKSGAGTLTLTDAVTLNTASALTVSEGEMKLEGGMVFANGIETFTKKGDGTLTLVFAEGDTTLKYVDLTVESGILNIEQSGESLHEYANSYTVMSGAVVNDERRMGSSDNLTFTGGGVYNVAGIALSREGYYTPCALTVESGTTLHITGTDVAGENGVATDGSGGAFLLGNYAADNTVNIRGTLISDAGISNINSSPTINVENGGTLQLNAGLSGSNYNLNESTDVTLNVNSGGVLVVNSSNTTNTDRINVELDQATVFTTEGATIANDMSYNRTVSLGAAQDKTLSLTKAGQVDMYKLTILGTADAVNGVDAGGAVAFSGKVSGMGITLNEGAQFAADGGLNLRGALTLSSNALATLSGDVYVGSLENAGSLDVSGASSLSIGAIDFSVGQSYHVGTVVTSDTFTTDDFLALIGTGGDSSLKASYDAATGMLSFDSSIYWLDGTEAGNTNSLWSNAENWSTGGDDSFTLAGVTVKLGAEATKRNVVLDSDVDANTTVHVAEAYTMTVQEGESHALNGRLEYAANDAAGLTKAGDGTLTMSLENATLGKGVHIADGTLEVLGTQTENSADGKVVAGGFAANGPHDLTAVSADETGTLSVKLYGNVNNNTFDTTALTLSDDFRGTLEVTHGYLMIHYSDTMKTTLGGTTKIRLDGGGVALRDNDTLVTAIEVGADGGWIMGRNAGNEYSGDITGAGTLTLVSNWGGDDVLTLSGSITLGDYETADDQGNPITAHSSIVKKGGSVVYITGADNNINITGGVTAQGSGQLVFQNKQTLHSLAINGGTVSLEKDVTLGSMSMNAATLTVGTAATDEAEGTAATVTITSDAVRADNHNANRTVTLNSGSVVNDAAQWQLTGGTLTLNGEGVYNVAGMKLAADQASATTLTIESGTTLHVTGETDHATQNNGSFVLAHWNSANTVNVTGKLALECGISTHSNYTSQSNINVEDGGTIAFNQGLTAAGRDDAAIINIAGGGTLEVSGTDTTGTNLVTVNVADGAFIMGGNANGATGALIANNLVFNNGAYIGAKEGTTLTIAPEAGSMRINWLDIIGTDYGAGGKVVFGSDLSVGAALKILAGAEAEMQGNLTLTNVYGVANAGTLTLSGDVDAPTISNTNTGELIFDGAGLITLDDAMSNEGLIRFTNVDDMRITLDALEVSGSYGGAMRKWQIISNTGTLEGWTKDAITLDHFILNGETLSLEGDEWDGYELGADGSLTLYQSYRYWDSAGEDSSLWDTESGTVWRDRTTMEGLTYEANSRVAFGEYEDGDDINGNPATLVELNKNVTVAEAGVLAKNLDVFGTGYVFEGGKITVTKALSIQQDATFNNTLVIGDATNALDINVDSGKTMTLNTLETLSTVKNGVLQYNAEGGSFRKTGEGILSITGAVAGVINSAAVEAGTLQLGDTVSLTVGANRITGGSLQNVVLSGAGTSISAFAEGSDAVLADVQLNAGSSTAYATVQDVTFAGTSTLTGYITFEKTQSAQDMQVAAGGSLTISNLTLDLHGLAAGEKQIILNSATTEGLGSISNWDTVKLVYSGVAVNAGTVDLSTVGVVKIAEKGAALYWDGLADGSAAAIWNTTSTNWSAAAGTDGDSLFYALSDTYFGATPEGAAKEISLMQDVVMTNLFFTEGGYTINGSYRMATLGDVKITHDSGDVTINTTLVAQGNIVGSGAGHVIFGGDTTAVRDITLENAAVTVGADMEAQGNISIASKSVTVNAGTMSAAGDISIESGSSAAGDAGSFTLASGTGLSATNITIDVDGGAESDDHFQDVYVNAEGSINATGTLTITGSAAKAFAGDVAAGDVVVDQTGNKVTFDMLTTNTLTITQGTTAHLLNTGASIRSVKLAGTLGFEKFAGAYGGHNIVSTSADAAVSFATITSVTLASLSGDTLTTDADGNPLTYGSITFGTNYRNLTINRLSNIQNITIGAGEYGATFNNATGGIHGNLTLEGGKLTVNSANIMANGTGQWNISGNLVLGHNTQTLAGNTISLTNGFISGNATHTESYVDEKGEDITINVRNQGLAYTANATINYGGESTISANMTLAADTTLTLQAAHATGQAGGGDSRNSADSLLLSGSLSGRAALLLQGDGVVTVSGANADYNGTVTVGTESTLELANTAALSAATISVQDSGTLQLNAGGTVNVADLQLADGAALSIFGLAATDVPSLADAALLNTDAGISWVPNAEGNLTLHVLFDAELENMKTYNLFNDVQSLAASGVSLNVMHNGVALDASQYKVGYDADAKLVYIRTMLGNIWDGGAAGGKEPVDVNADGAAGYWSTTDEDCNWTGKDYQDGQAAIFVDLPGVESSEASPVSVILNNGEVAPGDVYFEADSTYYSFRTMSTGGGKLAAGTNIHKAGSGEVALKLTNNADLDNAIGNIDLQAGTLTLENTLAVAGTVNVAHGALLLAKSGARLLTKEYTVSGTFSGLMMDTDSISGMVGTDEKGNPIKGKISSTQNYDVSIVGSAEGSVTLEHVSLKTGGYYNVTDSLTNVTIGEDVDVTGNYTLYGAMVFNNTLANSGTVTLDAAMTAEIGKLDYSFHVDEDGASWYTYQLVQGGTINGMNDLLVSDVTIGGVSLGSDGLADGVATYISSADGSITLSIGNYVLDENGNKVTDENGQAKVDGTIGVPLWDERWHDNTDEQPSLSRRYAGTDAAANVTFGEGIEGNAEYYWYSSVVSAANADKVNGTGDEVVATLSSASTGNRAAGGSSAASSGLEMWIFDRSGFDTVIGGQYTASLNNGWKQEAATHVLVNSVYDGADDDTEVDQKTWVVGGSWNTAQTADSHVTIQNGNILNVVGGTYGANQEADSYVYVDGGTVYELFAGGYDAAEDASYYGDVANTYLSITGGTLGYHPDDSVRKRVYGGSYYGKVSGNVQITVDGDASMTDLVGGGYHGTVGGNITMDLVSGTVTGSIDAAGIGGSTVNGNVLVNLYQGFNLAEIYGGKQGSSGATVAGTSTLHFAEADTAYDLTQKKVQGFSHFTLADGAMVKVSTDSGSLTDASGVLTIGGAGMVELVGGADIGRNITLIDGATLWFNSDDAGNYFSTADNRPTITATAGTTLEITGMPNNGQGLCFWVDLAGHGVDGKGAMYKGLSGAATVPTGKVALPRITLSDSASIGTDDNICVIENHNNESELFLNGNTLTKLGDNALMLYNTTVKDNTNANAVVDGTIYVKEGTLSTGYGMRAAKTNIVVGADTLLDVTNTGTADVVVGALSGSGNVSLSNNLTLTTSAAGSYGEGSDWMTQGADAYGQFSKVTGFAYGVYSGTVSGSLMLNIAGNGTQYLSGSESTFTGGVHLKESATLYLLGSTNGAATAAGSSSATSGVVGTGAIAWDSADATLYLGDGVRVYNNGTTNVAGSNMIIGVEAAPAGDPLTNYAGTHTSVVLNGVEYVEIATHNLYSISCDGLYADGTTYVAGSAINRDKMLLVTKTEWDAGTATVQGFSSGGYNEATYSGVLGGQANLVKVGLGTLVLDQKNSYTGSTSIEAGTLALKGWAQIGGSSSSAALNVVQTEGSTLMLAYDGTYEGEITGISNNIALSGTGDARWTTESRTGNATAALISDVGGNVTFSLTGNISGDGNLLHSGAGTLVLSGDSTYTGGTHATGGVVEVQSATGMGAGAVQFEADAALHATVEAGTTASRLTTTLDEPGSYVKGKVNITGTDATERVLSVNTAGYAATNTTVDANGTLLVNGAGVQAATGTLGGTGKLVVSDATASGAKASVGALTEFTGDMVVEGNKAAIEVANGNYSGGSISISGQDAKLTTAGNVNIAYGEKLELKSNGSAASGDDNTAAALSAAAVNVAAGGTLSVSNSGTSYRYNLAGLQQAASAAVNEMLDSGIAGTNMAMGNAATTDYTYHFDSSRALNAQTAGMVEGGLTLNSDSRYEERQANISLAGGALTLNTADGKIALDLLTNGNVQTYDDGYTSQIVLFSGVSSLTLDGTPYGEANAIMMMAAADGEAAAASNTVYSTLASNYFTGWNITDATQLVYDVGAGVVYLDKAVPEPTTTTLSILALAALVARRRRK